ncbi:MAG: hypothetical protein RLZZ326_3783, partial [Planctomycetota bacterium]
RAASKGPSPAKFERCLAKSVIPENQISLSRRSAKTKLLSVTRRQKAKRSRGTKRKRVEGKRKRGETKKLRGRVSPTQGCLVSGSAQDALP